MSECINNEKHEQIQEMVKAHAVGVQNVYAEVQKIRKLLDASKEVQDRCKDETLPVDEAVLTLRVKSYPMDIKVFITIETNFGQIDDGFSFPPFNEDKLSEVFHRNYYRLLNELYEAHEARGGHFIGEENCKEWMDKNGKTIIHKDPSFKKGI